jgi:TDG/mug DNA glycosylase family protein
VPHQRTDGFPPLLGPRPRVLILGSLPSQLSVRNRQYYGNPQNAFWSIMGELLGADPSQPYSARTKILTEQGIAVWDVLANSVRLGSMDSAIDQASAVINDFEGFFARNREIRMLCFNGQTAAKIFSDRASAEVQAFVENIECATLPSTSPAYASMNFADKLNRWSIISIALRSGNCVQKH